MESEKSFSMPPPSFDGNNYQVWAVKMTVYLEALDLWESIQEELPEISDDSTIMQIKSYKEKKTNHAKTKSCLYAAVSSSIFTRIMNLKSAKDIWEYLKTEYKGNERTRTMQVLNLIREFEMLKMEEKHTIKEYCEKLVDIANKVRLLGKDFPDEKILVTLPAKYEAKISSLEETKDLSNIALAELVNALQAQEQRWLMREEGSIEGAFRVRDYEKHQTCQYCKKKNHTHVKCWWRPDAKCEKCGQMGHIAKICKWQKQEVKANNVADQIKEEDLF